MIGALVRLSARSGLFPSLHVALRQGSGAAQRYTPLQTRLRLPRRAYEAFGRARRLSIDRVLRSDESNARLDIRTRNTAATTRQIGLQLVHVEAGIARQHDLARVDTRVEAAAGFNA